MPFRPVRNVFLTISPVSKANFTPGRTPPCSWDAAERIDRSPPFSRAHLPLALKMKRVFPLALFWTPPLSPFEVSSFFFFQAIKVRNAISLTRPFLRLEQIFLVIFFSHSIPDTSSPPCRDLGDGEQPF